MDKKINLKSSLSINRKKLTKTLETIQVYFQKKKKICFK